jgi:UDP-glucose 4-epimerase
MEDPASDFNHSVMATFNLLDAMRLNAPGCRFLYPSSAAVYGNPSRLPVNESQKPNPISPYGFHKLICEQLAAEFHKVYGLPTAIVRIFSAYGVGLKRQVLWDICQKASAQNILLLQGTGNESRDFIHVSDIALAILLLAEKSPCKGDIYNLASGTETTIRGLQEIIVSELGLEIPVEFNGLVVPGDPINWRADVSRISLMGFRPEIDLREGVASYAKWYLTEVRGRG